MSRAGLQERGHSAACDPIIPRLAFRISVKPQPATAISNNDRRMIKLPQGHFHKEMEAVLSAGKNIIFLEAPVMEPARSYFSNGDPRTISVKIDFIVADKVAVNERR